MASRGTERGAEGAQGGEREGRLEEARAYSVLRGFPGSSLRPGTEGPGPGLAAREGVRELRLVSDRSVLRGFSGARVRDLEPRRCVPSRRASVGVSRSATPTTVLSAYPTGRECLAARASTHGDERRRSAGSCSEHVPGARKAHQATPGALIVDQSRGKRAVRGSRVI